MNITRTRGHDTSMQNLPAVGQLFFIIGILLIPIPSSICNGETIISSAQDPEACITDLIRSGPASMTLGEARNLCLEPVSEDDKIRNIQEPEDDQLIEERLSIDQTNILKPFTLMSHRNNYILLGAHNFQGWDASVYEEAYEKDDLVVDDTEAQFQLSIKTPLAVNLFDQKIDLFAAYTIRSFWQLYNTEVSSPFRETNHEPEIWLQLRSDWEIFGFHHKVTAIGLNHMSNGQGGSLSRSWNRVYAAFAFERDNLVFLLRPWLRLEEDLEDDDNPDITDYYGHGELWIAYKYKDHLFSMMTRNNLESGFSRGAVELGWSFPLFDYPFLKGYIQYFSGYGESLVDYDKYVNRIGIGLQLTDVL